MSTLASIILAAGKGTRMKSDKAKVTFSLAGKSLVQRVVETSLTANCNKICVVVGYKKESVIDSIKQKSELLFCEQTEQLGTGHAVKMAEDVFKTDQGEVFILCGDVPLLKAETLQKMYKLHKENKSYCTVLTMLLDEPGRYGRMIRDKNDQVQKIVEYKDANDVQRSIKEVNTGIYCFDIQSLFDALNKINNNNEQHEYYLTDVLEIFYNEGKRIDSIILDDVSEAAGVNSQEQLAELETEFNRRINLKWLNMGVVIENPSSVIISEESLIDNDVVIHANSIIRGNSVIRKNSIIGPNSFLDNAIINKKCVLKANNIVVNQELKENSILTYMEKLINE